VVVGQLDCQFLLGGDSEEDGPGVAQVADVALVPLDEDGDGAGARAGVVDAAALQLLLRVLEHLRQVVLHVLFGLELPQLALVRTFLKLGRNVVVRSLARLAPRRSVAVVHCEKVCVVAQILQHAAGILALLFLGAGTHQAGDAHSDSLERVDFALDAVRTLVLLFLLLALASAEDAQKVHLFKFNRNRSMI
jgi:hypothetical protein